ncbi:MAG TPA: pirin family protein [Thermoanaerobaculia bacterium]|nr:pirin family protein [Thermoanaerobaculia bacterium]
MTELESYPVGHAVIGMLDVRRALPLRQRRLVGPWCFLDRYGPLSFTNEKPMDLGPHPHIGLQTVSYLLEGEVIHHDSLGYEALLRPGEVNLMTSGRGIAHAEEIPRGALGRLNGVQLWIAMPDETQRAFEHRNELTQAGSMTLFVDAPTHRGGDIRIDSKTTIALNRNFEHALLVLDGSVEIEHQPLATDMLHYLGTGRDEMELSGRGRILIVGGEPFAGSIVMWRNFVARTTDELVAARDDWQRHERFGDVRGAEAARIDAPALTGKALGKVRPPAAS